MARVNCAVIYGGTGFIGVFYADLLLRAGGFDKVYLYDLEPVAKKGYAVRNEILAQHGAKIVEVLGDVRQPIEWRPAETVGLIANFAAVHREPGHEDIEYFETNIKGAENVCAWADEVGCRDMVFTSSISPYGGGEGMKDERTIPVPNTAYGSSKLAAEKIHQIWLARQVPNASATDQAKGLVIARPGVVFGPSEGGNVSRMVRAVRKGYFFYAGNRDVRKAGIYVKELCLSFEWARAHQKASGGHMVLYNGTFSPCPSLGEYVAATLQVSGWKRHVPAVPIGLLLMASYIFEAVFTLLGRPNNFSPVRIRKLKRPNDIRPKYLLEQGYQYGYSLLSAFQDWRKQDKELWG